MSVLYVKDNSGKFVPIPTIKGKDGTTPHIGTNGNWFVGETDTGVSASGGGSGEVTAESIKTALGYTPEREKMQVFVVRNEDGSHGLYVTGEDGNFEEADLEILSENLMWLEFIYVGDIEVLGGKLFATEEAIKIVFDDFINKRRIVATLRTESTVVDVAYEYAPTSAEAGTDGQFAISDGHGGIRWVSLINVGEVGA